VSQRDVRTASGSSRPAATGPVEPGIAGRLSAERPGSSRSARRWRSPRTQCRRARSCARSRGSPEQRARGDSLSLRSTFRGRRSADVGGDAVKAAPEAHHVAERDGDRLKAPVLEHRQQRRLVGLDDDTVRVEHQHVHAQPGAGHVQHVRPAGPAQAPRARPTSRRSPAEQVHAVLAVVIDAFEEGRMSAARLAPDVTAT